MKVKHLFPALCFFTSGVCHSQTAVTISGRVTDFEGKAERTADLSVKPENLKVKVYADDELLAINSIQAVTEFEGAEKMPVTACLVQVDAPGTIPSKPYVIFRVEAENTEFGEKGENLYFYELKNYNR
ncbi:MAG: hypothetical protein LBJ23_02870 [Tannerella sp.]|jgi:hypothetical protein|nr:hypothetical protein [Tannerella sp.]